MDFITKLKRSNFLATYSLMKIIDSKRNIDSNSIFIQLLPSFLKYKELFPEAFKNKEDNYVGQRQEVANYLKKYGVLKIAKKIKRTHPWAGELKIVVEEDKFEKTLNYMRTHHSERFKSNIEITKDKGINEKEFNSLDLIFEKFHEVATKLTDRYNKRSTLIINDEYDVQDLLNCLLPLFFSDIRKEEWTPSYASSSSRMDFLLKNENIVIETKKATSNRTEKKFSEELIIDITKYKEHQNCEMLICFIYDPDNMIRNRNGFIKDLEKMSDKDIVVNVVVKPEFK